MQTSQGKGGSYLYDIHFWIGRDTSQDEAGTAAIKTVELDASLGGRAVQHREIQGHESEKFLSYFKPCIIPLEGGVASGFKKPEEEQFETRLYVCRGKRVIRMKQALDFSFQEFVPFARSSLNHDDVFILDTESKIFQFNGANSNIQERAKALEVVQFLKDKNHEGKCDVAIVDDGKLDTESDSGEFWVLFGGFAPIGKKIASEDDIIPESTPAKLHSVDGGEVKVVDGELSKSLLENNKCYLLDCGAEVFVWVGRVTQVEERKAAIQVAEEFIASQNRPKATRVTRVIQGYETHSFKSNFESWPVGSATTGAEEGRGKVAALLKQQGLGLKGLTKSAPVNEEVPPLLEGGGKMEEDQKMATRLTNTMFNSLKGRPVQGRIFEGKEPPQFIALFQPFVVLKGGLSSSYKKVIADKALADETYTADSVALIRISQTSIHNNKAVQVEAVATSLNSTECFVLQSGSSVFSWHGNQSTFEQQQLAAKVAEFLKPGATVKHAKEGTESSTFWFPLGGKQSYNSKKVSQDIVRDPHLYAFSFSQGKFQVEEIYNFSQDDLLTEDILILDTQAEVFIWIGHSVDPKEKQNAWEIGQKYVEMAACLEGLSPNVPLYKVSEGNEPCFFTTYFSWDYSKAIVQGNSFQKKVTLLFGIGHNVEEKSNGNQGGGPTQRASALAALSSAFNPSADKSTHLSLDKSNGSSQGSGPRQRAEALAALTSAFKSSPAKTSSTSRVSGRGKGSQRAAAVAALSSVLTAEKKKPNDSSPPPESNVPAEQIESPEEVLDLKERWETTPVSKNHSDDADVNQEGLQEENGSLAVFSYNRLKARSDNPVTGIDLKKREAYLSDEEFQTVFGTTKEAFYKLPKWKQDMQKKKADLF
ncbi:Villin-2, partial [Cucurbita argyrosperma subsp. argyrosperma]